MGWVCAAPIQDSYNDVSQKRGSNDCNSSSSSDEDSRNHKTAKMHTAATAAKLVLFTHCASQSICVLSAKHAHKTPDAGLCTRQYCNNSNTILDLSTKQLVSSPELLSHQKLELLRLKQVEVLAQGVTLLHRATIGQSQVPQLVHMLEEEPLNLYVINAEWSE